MTSITIIVPHPPTILRPNNGHGHHMAKHRAAKALRTLAKCRAIQALAMQAPPLWAKARVRVTWRCTKRIHPDPDNIIACLKSAFDGLADAGVVVNDRGLWPERPIIETRAAWPEVVIRVEGEDAE